MRRPCTLWLLAIVLNPASMGLGQEDAARRILKSNPQREFFVYLPKGFDKEKTYRLLAGVHGLGGDGKGAQSLSGTSCHAAQTDHRATSRPSAMT